MRCSAPITWGHCIQQKYVHNTLQWLENLSNILNTSKNPIGWDFWQTCDQNSFCYACAFHRLSRNTSWNSLSDWVSCKGCCFARSGPGLTLDACNGYAMGTQWIRNGYNSYTFLQSKANNSKIFKGMLSRATFKEHIEIPSQPCTGPGQWYHGHPRSAWYRLGRRPGGLWISIVRKQDQTGSSSKHVKAISESHAAESRWASQTHKSRFHLDTEISSKNAQAARFLLTWCLKWPRDPTAVGQNTITVRTKRWTVIACLQMFAMFCN